jgi:hypothetical protein
MRGQARANTPTDVDVSIVGGAPIVAYEHYLLNQCWFSGKTSGLLTRSKGST